MILLAFILDVVAIMVGKKTGLIIYAIGTAAMLLMFNFPDIKGGLHPITICGAVVTVASILISKWHGFFFWLAGSLVLFACVGLNLL